VRLDAAVLERARHVRLSSDEGPAVLCSGWARAGPVGGTGS
jgi:hypothetical protein